MAEPRRKPPIVATPRRKHWREHVRLSSGELRPTVWTAIRLPNGDQRGKTFTAATRVQLRLRDQAESRQFLFLPGTKIPRPAALYWQDMVSLPLVFAEVEGRLWRSRAPVRRFPQRPIREVSHG